MADIVITCASCGHERKISEYASAEESKCPDCGAAVEVPSLSKETTLSVCKTEDLRPQALAATAEELATASDEAPPAPQTEQAGASTLEEVYKVRGKVKKTRPVLGLLTFVFFAAMLLWLQMLLRADGNVLLMYNWVRGVCGGVIYILVLLVAFEDTLWQGLVGVVFPPYTIYYALVRLDSHVLRGLFLAFVVALGAELYFVPQHSFINHSQTYVNSVIRGGEGFIQRAGEAPTFD